jgi:hypothetical protein
MPAILEAAAEAGAQGASLIPLRLPGSVKDVFTERMTAAFPLAAEKVLRRTREMRGGKLYDARFGARMTGEGEMWQTVERLFHQTCARLGLNRTEGQGERGAFEGQGELGAFEGQGELGAFEGQGERGAMNGERQRRAIEGHRRERPNTFRRPTDRGGQLRLFD